MVFEFQLGWKQTLWDCAIFIAMKQKQDQLFLLIASLSVQERRYIGHQFNLMPPGKGRYYYLIYQIYLRHLDQPEERAQALEASELPSHLPVLRYQCFNWILEKLRMMHSKRKVELQIRHLLQEAEILFDRSLFTAARRKIKNGLDLIRKHQRYELFGDAYRLQINLDLNDPKGNGSKLLEEFQRFQEEFSHNQASQSCLGQLWSISHQLAATQHLAGAGASSLEELERHLLSHEAQAVKSVRTQIYYLQCQGTLCVHKGDLPGAVVWFRALLETIESDAEKSPTDQENYAIALCNYAQILTYLQEESLLKEKLDEQRRNFLKSQTQKEDPYRTGRRALYYFSCLFTAMHYFYEEQRFQTGVSEFQKALKQLPLPHNINAGAILYQTYFLIGTVYFKLKKWETARSWLEKIPLASTQKRSWVIRGGASVYLALIAYEKGNVEKVERVYKSWLQGKKRAAKSYPELVFVLKLLQRLQAAMPDEMLFIFREAHTKWKEFPPGIYNYLIGEWLAQKMLESQE